MRVVKPDVCHISDTIFEKNARMSITCIDLTDKYLATGSDDTNIKIWDIESLINNQPQNPKVLNYHHGSLQCISFLDKDTLISCSIDGMLAVWFNFQVVGSANSNFVPHDLAISNDKSVIALCNIHGDCNIYKMSKSPVLISTIFLDLPIKTICFDPLGQFIALLSTKELIIYDITKVDQPQPVQSFKKQIDKTSDEFTLKLSYSPDGQQLAVPSTFHSKLPACLLITRDLQETSLIHFSKVCLTCFSPKLYNRSFNNESVCSILATVSLDNYITLWMSCVYEPLCVIKESIFTNSISSMHWHNDGLSLAVSSLDGSVVFFNFTADELGEPLTEHEMAIYLQQQGIAKVSSAPISIKEIELLDAPVYSVQKVPVAPTTNSNNLKINKTAQKTTIGKDGKKRIQPTTTPLIQNTHQPTMVPVYDICLNKNESFILTSIKEQTAIEHGNCKYTVLNNTPDKNYSEIQVSHPEYEFKRILETDNILFITVIEEYLVTISVSHEMLIFTKSLRQIMLPVLLESQVFCITSFGNRFAMLNQLGTIDVYVVSSSGLKLESTCQIAPVLRNEHIIRIDLNNHIEITLITAKATYIYNRQLEKWMKSSASEFEVLNDRYEIKENNQINHILNSHSSLKSAATRQYLEVVFVNLEAVAIDKRGRQISILFIRLHHIFSK
eukprot:NODE_46_length_27655_cov_0.671796.p3 type:complete len:670 gc:universal NODE_46_length_27655_cov_0.671796:21523-19514(-)